MLGKLRQTEGVVGEIRRLLANSRGRYPSIKEIAFVTGYADPCNFHRTFARHTGMTLIANIIRKTMPRLS
jgi:AraC-like DNA-binding protein